MTGRERDPVDADVATVRSVLHCHPARLDADTALDRLAARLEATEAALRAYHELMPALADCANECGAQLLYSEAYQANKNADTALRAEDAPDA